MFQPRSNKTSVLASLVAATGACLALLSVAAPASASVKPHDPSVHASTAPAPGYDQPYNYPKYDPRYEVQPIEQSDGLDAASVALGALGGIAFAGAGLGITLGVQRRRDHSALQPT